MTTNIKTLDWSQRLAIISTTKATDKQASAVFGVEESEIITARANVSPATNFDVTPYASHFATSKATTSDTTPATSGTVVKKKRGRTGSKVKQAFSAITETPQPLDEFSKQHGVSVNVLKQKKRFTTDQVTGETFPEFAGKVFKVVQHNGVDSIWFENADSSDNAKS